MAIKKKDPEQEIEDEIKATVEQLILDSKKGVVSLDVRIEMDIGTMDIKKALSAEMDAVGYYVLDILERTKARLKK